MSKHQTKPSKVYQWQIDAAAKSASDKAMMISQLEQKLSPGQHILTCSHCGKMGIFPTHVGMVTHVNGTHPWIINK